MDDEFDVEIDADGNARATHRVHGHIYEFVVIPTEPHVAGGTVRQNQSADRDYPEFFSRLHATRSSVTQERGGLLQPRDRGGDLSA
jgi:hypothetical protein